MQTCSAHQGTSASWAPPHARAPQGDPPPSISRNRRPSTIVCVCVIWAYIQTHALSHTQRCHTGLPVDLPTEHSLSTVTSATSSAQSRDPGGTGHTRQTRCQWNGTFNCFYISSLFPFARFLSTLLFDSLLLVSFYQLFLLILLSRSKDCSTPRKYLKDFKTGLR